MVSSVLHWPPVFLEILLVLQCSPVFFHGRECYPVIHLGCVLYSGHNHLTAAAARGVLLLSGMSDVSEGLLLVESHQVWTTRKRKSQCWAYFLFYYKMSFSFSLTQSRCSKPLEFGLHPIKKACGCIRLREKKTSRPQKKNVGVKPVA